MSFQEKEYKSILEIHQTINPWLWNKYSLNPYQGCQFGCINCAPGQDESYLSAGLHHEIVVKSNAAELLEGRIKRSRVLLPDVVALGGAGDPYQPAESIYQNTRRCLEILTRYRYPVHVLTKSRLVLWDLDLLNKIGEQGWCSVTIAMTTRQAEWARIIEPKAPEPDQRLDIIRVIKEKSDKIMTGVLFTPILPFPGGLFGLEEIVKAASEAGADYFLFHPVMSRKACRPDRLRRQIAQRCPEMLTRYDQLCAGSFLRLNDRCSSGQMQSLSLEMSRVLGFICPRHQIPEAIPRFIPDDFRRDNYLVAEHLFALSNASRQAGRPLIRLYRTACHIQNLKASLCSLSRDEWQAAGIDDTLLPLIHDWLA